MKIDNMRELYEELLRATSNGYRNRSIANPAVDFTKKAKAGDFDEMSDEEYYQALDKVNELNDVWQHRPSGQIGELLFTALENLTLSDSDVEDMAATLLCAYERSSKEHIPCDAKAADRNERTAGYAASKEIDSDNPSKTKTQSDKRSTDAKGILSSPVKIYEYLDRRVYGQKEAKRAAAMLLWNHVNCRPYRLWQDRDIQAARKAISEHSDPQCHLSDGHGLEGQYKGQKSVRWGASG